jgi:hypothetical protein
MKEATKVSLEIPYFQEIVNRLKQFGRIDEFGNRHLGHWTYRIEDGGMTQVVVNSDIGIAYYRVGNNEVEGHYLKEHA